MLPLILILKSHVQLSKRLYIILFHLHEIYKLHKSTVTESILLVARSWSEKWRVTTSRYGVSLGSNKGVLEVDSGDSCTTVIVA